uniref:DUF1618 domain-containing protein n=1 Tax=Setaria viridis TaxID=4556 RepID=A0A4U6SW30_SETVI|nr:hypothetical protein SEVIR_9G208100v2 [Setaria viridis]
MRESAVSASGCSNFPAWVLLDTVAKIGRCKNETTAQGTTSAGLHIEVSFELVDPPGLSRCVIYCPESDLTARNSKTPPSPSPSACITGADGAFLLVRVAGPGTPSLYLLPQPYPVHLLSNYVGVLSCGGGDASEHCLVVVPERWIGPDHRLMYDLQVFSTKIQSWSTKDPRFDPTKVFSVAGGSLAWVDVRSRILLCKEVDDDPEMLLIQLPALMGANVQEFGVDSDDCSPPMDPIRDVTFRNGRFRFIEMESLVLLSDSTSQRPWTAAMFERKVCSEDWERCCSVDSNDLMPADSCFPYLFPEIYDYEEKKLTLNRVVSFLPTLDQ